MAEYMLVEEPRRLVPLTNTDPVDAAPMTDAALTPYRAIKRTLPRLGAGSTAVLIGAGGLGHMAAQILAAMTPATVISIDTRQSALDIAASSGATHTVLVSDNTADEVRDLMKGRGATAIFDFVGTDQTMALAAKLTEFQTDIVIVGVAGGTLPFSFFTVPYEIRVTTSMWGSLPDLYEVLALAERGLVKPHIEKFSLDNAMQAYEKMESGELLGRAVIVP
jgi:propanol-preferring alcohol dehydrogenase